MKKIFENWNKYKEGLNLNEISGKQKAHIARQKKQQEERAKKDAEAQELYQLIGKKWDVNVRWLEDRYQITVNKAFDSSRDAVASDAQELDQLIGDKGWKVNVKKLEGRNQITVNKASDSSSDAVASSPEGEEYSRSDWEEEAAIVQKQYRDRMSGVYGDEWIPEKSTKLSVSIPHGILKVAVEFDGKLKHFDDFPQATNYIDRKLGYTDDDEYWHPGVQSP